MMNLALLFKYKSYLAVLLLVFLCSFISFKLTNTHWQTKWKLRDKEDAISDLASQARELNRSLDNINAISSIQQKAEEDLAKVSLDASNANDSVSRLQLKLRNLQADRAQSKSTTTETSETAQDTINMLANLLSKSVERSRQLANYADNSRVAGLTCEKAYDSLK